MCLLDVENGQVEYKQKVSAHPAMHMSWTEQEPVGTRSPSTWSGLYAPNAPPRCCYEPGPLSAMPPVAAARAGTADKQWGASCGLERLSILCAADAGKRISLLAFGSFPLAAVDIGGSSHLAGPVEVLHVRRRPLLHAAMSWVQSVAQRHTGMTSIDMVAWECRQRSSRTSFGSAQCPSTLILVRRSCCRAKKLHLNCNQ